MLLVIFVLCLAYLVVDYLNWWKVVIGGIFLILGVWVFCYVIQLESDYEKEWNKHFDYKEKCQLLQNENDFLTRENKSLKEKLDVRFEPVPAEVEVKTETTVEENTIKDDSNCIPCAPSETDSSISKTTTVFEYYSSPNSNGQFRQYQCKKMDAVDCFYRIKYENGAQRGIAELLEKKDYERLLNYKTDCLYPVCQVESQKQDAKTIIMKAPGSVILQDGVWSIENGKKIKIIIE